MNNGIGPTFDQYFLKTQYIENFEGRDEAFEEKIP